MKWSRLNRRQFFRGGSLGLLAFPGVARAGAGSRQQEPVATPDFLDDRVRGLLLGSLIGDALGGPIEFQDPDRIAKLSNAPKRWTDAEWLDDQARRAARERLVLRTYRDLRPQPEPFGHWAEDAPPGTVTDDSRHKMILVDALRWARDRGRWPMSDRELAQAYLDWPKTGPVRGRSELEHLCAEWLEEWHFASRWCLGERDTTIALPPERIWNGLPTCCGQMSLLPLAALFPGQPDAAYRAAYGLAMFDNGWGKDLNAALVAALAVALVLPIELEATDAWKVVFDTLRQTDPYRYGKIPWVTRSVDRWLDLALTAAREAEGRPAGLFARLDREFRDTIKWEAQVPFVVTFAVLALCEFEPLTALQLSIEWGHDTDSYAQLVGAFIGARHGAKLFPESLSLPVLDRLRADYEVDLGEWIGLLGELRRRAK
jgi:ADP-ribosylglycohydrolase